MSGTQMSGRARLVGPAVFAALILSLAVADRSLAADPPPDEPQSEPQASGGPPSPSAKHARLSSTLVRLVEASQSVPQGVPMADDLLYEANPALMAYLTAGLMVLDDQGRVQVYVRISDPEAGIAGEVVSLGGQVERLDESGTLIQARVPVDKLPQVAALEYVTSVTLPNYGQPSLGSFLTEGDALLGLDKARAKGGVDGSGVTVGVISDGIFGLAAAIASGDLPATSFNVDGNGKLVSTTGGIVGTSFRADGNLEGGLGGTATGAEGTAILEIIHDIAPGAQLRFANFSTSLEFIAAVDFLAANSDVVIDDIAFFAKPFDQTSDVSANTAAELNKLANPIRGYYAAVGNHAQRHYQETYVDSGTDGAPFAFANLPGNLHQFAATGDTTDCLGLGPRIANSVRLGPGQTATIVLTWDDTFGAVTTDYDLYVRTNDTNDLAAFGIDDNVALGDPIEAVAFTNNTAAARFFDIFIQNSANASAAKTFDMFITAGGIGLACSAGTFFNYNTVNSSVPAQSDAGGGVVSVGAISASDPGVDTIEPFSSRGPTNNGVVKPDVVAIDGVAVSGSGGFPTPFFGTSAAAPHVAGLAALLLDGNPGLLGGEAGDDPAADRAVLRAAIVADAVDLGIPGVDNTYGSGRINGLAAGESQGFPLPIPSATAWGLVALAVGLTLLTTVYAARRRAV
ncbi:MAG: S8 family serine peptidase [Chloroflexi bacterium]|nr:S8 family serine peptidase [Chloroflexota bacterium]